MEKSIALKELTEKARELIKDVRPTNNTGYNKYLNVDYEIKSKLQMTTALGLTMVRPKKVLDISTCYGWMSWILKEYGHDCTVTDNIDSRITNPPIVRELLGLPTAIDFRYDKKPAKKTDPFYFKSKPLPVKNKFDVIIAGSVAPQSCFDKKEWIKFINNALKHLKKGGFIYISPNTSPGMQELEKVVDGYESETILRGWRIRK